MEYCTNCGEKILDNSKFCSKCGMKIEEVTKENKKISGFSITSMVLGICLHLYQLIFYIYVMFAVNTLSFFTSILAGKRVGLSFFEKLQGVAYLLRYSYPIIIAASIAGLVFGYLGLKKGNKKMANAGISLCSAEIAIIMFEILFLYPW